MQLKNRLLNRTLRFDGVSEIEPGELARFLLLGVPSHKLQVTEQNEEVMLLNAQVPCEDQVLLVGDTPVTLDMSWQLPSPYADLDLTEHFAAQFELRCPQDYTPEQRDTAITRIADELVEVQCRGMVQFMRTVIYILEMLRKNNIVWGVGRGSSCASYLLFIIGLHVVDCVKLQVPMSEFFHE